MHDSSFGARYSRIDDDGDGSLLEYLDALAALPAVRQAKRAATEALGLGPGDRALEVGCGTGVDLPYLAECVRPHGTVVGADPSVQALDVARRRIGDLQGVELTVARVEQLPFDGATFDACRVDRTLQHVPEPEQALREMRRVMRRGGRLVVLEMTSDLQGVPGDTQTAREAIDRRMWSADARPAWLPLMLPLLLSRTGFEDVELHRSESESRSLADADIALRLRASIDEAIRDGTLERHAADAWLEGMQTAERQGTLVLHMHFSRISAVAA